MKQLLKEWKKFLCESKEGNYIYNLEKIMDACDMTSNDTTEFYDRLPADTDEFSDIIISSGMKPVLENYKINEFLGSGAIGLAFSLLPPHEGYILKFQISYRETGSRNILDLYKRQEAGEFRPDEVRVLEAVNKKFSYRNSTYYANMFVLSKVNTKNVGGKSNKVVSMDDVMGDLYGTKAEDIIDSLAKATLNKNIERLRDELSYSFNGTTVDTMVSIFQKSTIDNFARFYYNLLEKEIKHLSRDQYVKVFKEYYRQELAARKEGRYVDFHAGNFGFRPKSDVPLSFDV